MQATAKVAQPCIFLTKSHDCTVNHANSHEDALSIPVLTIPYIKLNNKQDTILRTMAIAYSFIRPSGDKETQPAWLKKWTLEYVHLCINNVTLTIAFAAVTILILIYTDKRTDQQVEFLNTPLHWRAIPRPASGYLHWNLVPYTQDYKDVIHMSLYGWYG